MQPNTLLGVGPNLVSDQVAQGLVSFGISPGMEVLQLGTGCSAQPLLWTFPRIRLLFVFHCRSTTDTSFHYAASPWHLPRKTSDGKAKALVTGFTWCPGSHSSQQRRSPRRRFTAKSYWSVLGHITSSTGALWL